jgi:hypothetical protein
MKKLLNGRAILKKGLSHNLSIIQSGVGAYLLEIHKLTPLNAMRDV